MNIKLIPKEEVIEGKGNKVKEEEDIIIINKKKIRHIEHSKYGKRLKLKEEKSSENEFSVFRKGLSSIDGEGLCETEINRLLKLTDDEMLRLKRVKNLEWSVTGLKLDANYQKLLSEYVGKTNKDIRNLKIQRQKLAELLTKLKK